MNRLSFKFSLTGIMVIGFFLSMANLLYAQSEKINWISWEQAQEQLKTHKKKIFVDVVTDRCHWCKQMDNTTFLNSKIIKYINTNYYAIKFNAEQSVIIPFKGKTYEFIPTLVVMDEEMNTIQALSGFKSHDELEIIINYFGGNFHKTTPWSIYKESFLNKPTETPGVRRVNNQN